MKPPGYGGPVPDLLLLSNSRAPGMGFLEHAIDAIKNVLGDRASVLFVPFAGSDPDAYTTTMRAALARIGVRVTGLHEVPDVIDAIGQAEAIFVGGGNSFRLLRSLNQLGALPALREAAVTGGVPYLGASAGSNLACPTIRTTNDMPIVEVPSLSALGLIPFQLNPHYLDADPGSTHQGETRQQRLEEFLEENDVPVLGLREGSWLAVSGRQATLAGASTGRLLRREVPPAEVPAGTDLSYLLQVPARFDTGP
jgi:dipeptidase E